MGKYPGLAHLDGTARFQSVGRGDDAWLHALLHAVARFTGLASLINTSFNTRGAPLVNTVTECLQMLDELVDLDYVLIEDWLFRAPHKRDDNGFVASAGSEMPQMPSVDI